QFAVDIWRQRYGLVLAEPAATTACDRFSCVVDGEGGGLALWWGRRTPEPARLAELCAASEVVAVRAEAPVLPDACRGRLVLDGADFARGGAVELRRAGAGWTAEWAEQVRGRRPWSQW